MDTLTEQLHILQAGVNLDYVLCVVGGVLIVVLFLVCLYKLISALQERRLTSSLSDPSSWTCSTAKDGQKTKLVATEEKMIV